MSLEDLEVSGLLDTGATKTVISRELRCQVPDHQVVQHAAADTLQIQLPNCDELQSKGKVTLKANIKKFYMTFKALILNIAQPLILGMEFLEHFGVTLDYANGKATISMTGCKYPLSLCQELLKASKKKTPEASQQERIGQLLEGSYNEWKSLAKCKGPEDSIFWVREAQMGADSCDQDTDNQKLHWQSAIL